MTKRCKICQRSLEHKHEQGKHYICTYTPTPPNTPLHRFKSRMSCQERQNDVSSEEEELTVSTQDEDQDQEQGEFHTPLPKKRKTTQKSPKSPKIEEKLYLHKLLEKYQRDLEMVRQQLDKKLKIYEELRRRSTKVEQMIVLTEDFLNQLVEDEEGVTTEDV